MTGETKKPQGNPVILVLVLLVFGLVLGGFGLHRYRLGKESASWPNVKGTITYARPQSSSRDGKQEYMPSVRYSYTVDGASYSGTRITASDEYQKTRSGAEDILRDYPVGSDVSVFYNPDAPKESVLEAGMPKNVYVLLVAAAGCIVLSLVIATSVLKSKAKPTA